MALTDNLVAYYKLDGNSNDSVGSNNGTDTNISYVTGKIGSAGSFNGSSSRISLPAGARLTGNFTFSCWFNASSLTGDHHFYSDWSPSQKNFLISTSGSSFVVVSGNASTSQGATMTAGSLSTGTWYNLVVTRNGTTNKIYLNGAEIATQTIAYSGGTTTNNLYLGVYPDLSGGWMSGLIDETGLWSRALSAGEVLALYNGGAGLTYPFTTYNPAIGRRGLLV